MLSLTEVLRILKVLIVTNNTLVREACGENGTNAFFRVEVHYVDGDVELLLLKVRDMVYEGYPLLSHPLPSSMRMIYSPYRSVMLGASIGKLDSWYAETIEDSLRKYRRSTEYRISNRVNDEDYKWMDMQLLSAAFKEPRPYN